MIRHISYKIFSTVFAFIILFSTFSFTVDKHYCGDYLVNTALFSKAKGCGMEMQQTFDDVVCETIKTNCCKNKTTYVKGNSLEQQALSKQIVEHLPFVAVFMNSYVSLFEEKTLDSFALQFYKPPLIQKDILVLFENFRI